MNNEQQIDAEIGQMLSFDEYKMYYETTEKVTERRIAMNRWNYSVCVALIVGVAVLVGWCSSKPGFFVLAAVSIAVFSVAGMMFCAYWLSEIKAAKLLNAAKFTVLNDMAKQVRFDQTELSSFEPFAREWERLTASEGAKPIKRLNGRLALSSSGAELFTPRVFAFLFALIGLGGIGTIAIAVAVPAARGYLPLAPVPPASVSTAPVPSLVAPLSGAVR